MRRCALSAVVLTFAFELFLVEGDIVLLDMDDGLPQEGVCLPYEGGRDL